MMCELAVASIKTLAGVTIMGPILTVLLLGSRASFGSYDHCHFSDFAASLFSRLLSRGFLLAGPLRALGDGGHEP